MPALSYYRRVASAYLLRRPSQLTFWHERPEQNPAATYDRLGPYYMTFAGKAGYVGPFDKAGVPLLDYRGALGQQYNPIAVAQYGLARYNRYKSAGDPPDRDAFLTQARWLADNLEPNAHGVPVWHHKFDWEYVQPLRAPWYSGLAQGQGVSLLVRAHAETGDAQYLDAARAAFKSLSLPVSEGGVLRVGPDGATWVEEYMVTPPTHILNGFMWALWGVRDYELATGVPATPAIWDRCVQTLLANLARYDTGSWSLYDLSRPGRMKMLASPFYHRLHIVQLRVLGQMTGRPEFEQFATRWESYARSRKKRNQALAYKAAFKLLHY